MSDCVSLQVWSKHLWAQEETNAIDQMREAYPGPTGQSFVFSLFQLKRVYLFVCL